VQDQFGAISARAQENFSGIRAIKAYVREDSEIDAFNAVTGEYRSAAYRDDRWSITSLPPSQTASPRRYRQTMPLAGHIKDEISALGYCCATILA